MWKFDHDQTNSHRVMNKSCGVEECWSNIKLQQSNVIAWETQNTQNMSLSYWPWIHYITVEKIYYNTILVPPSRVSWMTHIRCWLSYSILAISLSFRDILCTKTLICQKPKCCRICYNIYVYWVMLFFHWIVIGLFILYYFTISR